MKLTVVLVYFILSLCYGGMAVSQNLPDDILADQYKLELTNAIKRKNVREAKQIFRKLSTVTDTAPWRLQFSFGKLLVEHGTTLDDIRRGQGQLEHIIVNFKEIKEYGLYEPILRLLSKAQRKGAPEQQPRQDVKRAAQVDINKLFQPTMVTVQGGTFLMGCELAQKDCIADQNPVHQVQVSSFRISKYEVTQEQWEAVMGTNPSFFYDCARCPVESVSWEHVQAFLKELNNRTGEEYRLPTEAEWEYAARGGQQSKGYHYAGSDDLALVAWYDENSGKKTHPVGQKQVNELGLYDMSGNVIEWVADWHGLKYYTESPNLDPKGPVRGKYRVLRGGSWLNGAPLAHSAARWMATPTHRNARNVGFRVAQDAP